MKNKFREKWLILIEKKKIGEMWLSIFDDLAIFVISC